MTLPMLTLTQAKGASTTAWAIVVVLEAIALAFPVKGLPLAVKMMVAALLLAAVTVIIYTSLSRKTEKPDERAAQNNYKTSSAIYELFFFLFALYVLLSNRLGWEAITVTRSHIILGFAALNLLHDGIFLLYERFGK